MQESFPLILSKLVDSCVEEYRRNATKSLEKEIATFRTSLANTVNSFLSGGAHSATRGAVSSPSKNSPLKREHAKTRRVLSSRETLHGVARLAKFFQTHEEVQTGQLRTTAGFKTLSVDQIRRLLRILASTGAIERKGERMKTKYVVVSRQKLERISSKTRSGQNAETPSN